MITCHDVRHRRRRVLESIGFVNNRHQVVLGHEIHHFRKPFGVANTHAVQVRISFDQVEHGQSEIYPGKIPDDIDMTPASQCGY